MENKRTEQEKLVLDNYEWDLLVKQLSSIVSKSKILLKNPRPEETVVKIEQILNKAMKCLEIIKYKNIKDE
jgi:hypothetical protein